MTDPQTRIAEALERLAPPAARGADPLAHPAYVWRGSVLQPVRAFRPLPLGRLHGIDAQKAALLGTVRNLAQRAAAHDVLLWGARGSGKSALVKAVVGAVQDDADYGALALVEIVTPQLDTLPALFARIADVPRAFLLFLDDLGFDAAADGRRAALDARRRGGGATRQCAAGCHLEPSPPRPARDDRPAAK